MNKRAASIVLATAVGLGATTVALGPTLASAATADSGMSSSMGDRLTAIKNALKGLVSDGTLTQSQADKVATTLDSALPERGHGGPGGPRGARGLEAAATALGVTVADLRTALESGKSLADVASSKGISRAALIAKLVSAAQAHLAEEVKEGHLTQAQADARKADLTTRITEQVDRKGLPGHPGHGMRPVRS